MNDERKAFRGPDGSSIFDLTDPNRRLQLVMLLSDAREHLEAISEIVDIKVAGDEAGSISADQRDKLIDRHDEALRRLGDLVHQAHLFGYFELLENGLLSAENNYQR